MCSSCFFNSFQLKKLTTARPCSLPHVLSLPLQMSDTDALESGTKIVLCREVIKFLLSNMATGGASASATEEDATELQFPKGMDWLFNAWT